MTSHKLRVAGFNFLFTFLTSLDMLGQSWLLGQHYITCNHHLHWFLIKLFCIILLFIRRKLIRTCSIPKCYWKILQNFLFSPDTEVIMLIFNFIPKLLYLTFLLYSYSFYFLPGAAHSPLNLNMNILYLWPFCNGNSIELSTL